MDRLFIAAWPDPDTSAALALLPRPDERGVRWSRPDQWHITLRFLGNCDRNQVAARLGDAVLPFAHARLGPAIDWLGPQLVVPVDGVDELAAAVHAATDGIGDPPRPQFRGHLTVARTRRNAISSMLGHPFEAELAISEVALVRSELTPDGARYETLMTVPTR
jgi:2'-5' RNA ligase